MESSTLNGDYEPAGISIRNGPVTDEMDVDLPAANGKRKARVSAGKPINYNDERESSSEEDSKPLVLCFTLSDISLNLPRLQSF
jgi:DNA topoisomerase-1